MSLSHSLSLALTALTTEPNSHKHSLPQYWKIMGSHHRIFLWGSQILKALSLLSFCSFWPLRLGGKNTHRRSGFVIWRSLPPTLSFFHSAFSCPSFHPDLHIRLITMRWYLYLCLSLLLMYNTSTGLFLYVFVLSSVMRTGYKRGRVNPFFLEFSQGEMEGLRISNRTV